MNEESILYRLAHSNVLSVEVNDEKNKLLFIEECDGWYQEALSKDDVVKLIDELKSLMENIKDSHD